MIWPTDPWHLPDSPRVADLRRRVRAAMAQPPCVWDCPSRIDDCHMAEPLAVRKARAIALKLSQMPTDLWEGQLLAGSMTLESPRLHAERGFPDYTTAAEREQAASRGLGIGSVFGHIVPDYPRLLSKGLQGIREEAEGQRRRATSAAEVAFLDSVMIALEAVMAVCGRLADRCEAEAMQAADASRASELRQMAANLRQVPAGPAQTFWQALQSVWLLHMVFHSTMNGNAVGRLDQYAWPYLRGRPGGGAAGSGAGGGTGGLLLPEVQRAGQDDRRPARRGAAGRDDPTRRGGRGTTTTSQVGTDRDRVDATNHWLQNIVIGGLTPEGCDGTNPLTHLLLRSYRRNQMTNPLLTVRLHRGESRGAGRRGCARRSRTAAACRRSSTTRRSSRRWSGWASRRATPATTPTTAAGR